MGSFRQESWSGLPCPPLGDLPDPEIEHASAASQADSLLPLVAQNPPGTVVDPPVTEETQVQSLGQEDPLVKEMATHSRILAWRIPWTEVPCGL